MKEQRSINGNIWQIRDYDPRQVQELVQGYDIAEIVARLLAIRGIDSHEVQEFVSPSLRNSLPDPSHLRDMDKAAQRVIEALQAGQKIVIFGDYDVDGATSSALLMRFFSMIGHDVGSYIPDRLAEGYGPNIPAIESLRQQGYDVMITVDCGAVSYEPLKRAKEIGLDVIVIDHHLGGDTLPEAIAVVNPNRADEISDHTNLAAVGVSFLFAVAINRLLSQEQKMESSRLLSLLDLVALGTVCDVMTLKGLNRTFVAQGLKIMAQRGNLGLRALGDVAGMDAVASVYHLGFILGPRINAGGRVGKASLGTELLTTQDIDRAYAIAQELDRLNKERKAIEDEVLSQAMDKAQERDEKGDAFLLVVPDDKDYWHPGVIGIVASRIKDKYNKPCAVLSVEGDEAKASARSVWGIDLGAAVGAARQQEILIAGGGHAMAAGFSVKKGRIEELRHFLSTLLAEDVAQALKQKTLKIDIPISLGAANIELLDALEIAEPFGNGNAEPRFLFENVKITQAKIVGDKHVMLFLKETGEGAYNKQVKAMSFGSVGSELGDALLCAIDKKIDVVGKVKRNVWQGTQKAEIIIDDAMFREGLPL